MLVFGKGYPKVHLNRTEQYKKSRLADIDTHIHTYGQTGRQTDRQMNLRTYIRLDGWTAG